MHFSGLAWFVGTKIQAHRRTILSLLGFLKILFSCSVNPYLALILSPTGAGRYHRGPPSGCDPPVSGVLPSLLLSSPLPHTSPAAIPASPSLHPQLSLFLSSRQPRGAASPSVLPTPPSPHVRRSRYELKFSYEYAPHNLHGTEFNMKYFLCSFSLQKSSQFMGCQTS